MRGVKGKGGLEKKKMRGRGDLGEVRGKGESGDKGLKKRRERESKRRMREGISGRREGYKERRSPNLMVLA